MDENSIGMPVAYRRRLKILIILHAMAQASCRADCLQIQMVVWQEARLTPRVREFPDQAVYALAPAIGSWRHDAAACIKHCPNYSLSWGTDEHPSQHSLICICIAQEATSVRRECTAGGPFCLAGDHKTPEDCSSHPYLLTPDKIARLVPFLALSYYPHL